MASGEGCLPLDANFLTGFARCMRDPDSAEE